MMFLLGKEWKKKRLRCMKPEIKAMTRSSQKGRWANMHMVKGRQVMDRWPRVRKHGMKVAKGKRRWHAALSQGRGGYYKERGVLC